MPIYKSMIEFKYKISYRLYIGHSEIAAENEIISLTAKCQREINKSEIFISCICHKKI